MGICIFGIDRRADTLTESILQTHRRIEQAERTGAKREVEVVAFARWETWIACAKIDCAGRTEVLGRLEDFALLTIVHRDFLNVIERKFAEVDLTILSIAELNTVVEDTHVVGAHAANIHRFHAADTTIVLDLHP